MAAVGYNAPLQVIYCIHTNFHGHDFMVNLSTDNQMQLVTTSYVCVLMHTGMGGKILLATFHVGLPVGSITRQVYV